MLDYESKSQTLRLRYDALVSAMGFSEAEQGLPQPSDRRNLEPLTLAQRTDFGGLKSAALHSLLAVQ